MNDSHFAVAIAELWARKSAKRAFSRINARIFHNKSARETMQHYFLCFSRALSWCQFRIAQFRIPWVESRVKLHSKPGMHIHSIKYAPRCEYSTTWCQKCIICMLGDERVARVATRNERQFTWNRRSLLLSAIRSPSEYIRVLKVSFRVHPFSCIASA
jgi:hypothetical protein